MSLLLSNAHPTVRTFEPVLNILVKIFALLNFVQNLVSGIDQTIYNLTPNIVTKIYSKVAGMLSTDEQTRNQKFEKACKGPSFCLRKFQTSSNDFSQLKNSKISISGLPG